MPKLKNLTADHFATLISDINDMIERVREASDMIDMGYVDRLPDVAQQSRTAAALAMTASTLTTRLQMREDMQRQEDELERLRAQVEAKSKA